MRTFLLLLLFLLLVTAVAVAQPGRIPIDGWTVRSLDGEVDPVQAPVPGVVHTALHEAGVIPDPFFGDNEQRLAWVDTTTWVYETRFRIPEGMEQPQLVFDGLDTIADVTLNGERVLHADNMFRRWTVPVNGSESEEQTLRIVFHPAAREAKRLAAAYPYELPESPRMFVRKAAYHFGWDWGPRFVTAGPWREVYLMEGDFTVRPRLEDISLRTIAIDDSTADVALTSDFYCGDHCTGVDLTVRMDGEIMFEGKVDYPLTLPGATTHFTISNPRLWWPAGYGEPYRYRLEVEAGWGGEVVRYEGWAGIRTVELRQTDGAMTFVINGVPIFAKGANVAPMTPFYPASEERYRAVMQAAVDANMNMLRVWGGGVYEDDLLYDLADSLGILVWQDFIFANALYPDTEDFLANVRQEAVEQVIRLRRHPSVVLWCGNNEIIEGWHNWGWQEQFGYSEADSLALLTGYKSLFEDVLPTVVSEHAPEIPYWPSSPSHGWGREIAYEEGDVHYWGVWWGRAPFESYREKVGRFNSEYGFQAYPVRATVETFAPPDSLTEESAAFRNHQKHPNGFEWLREYAGMTFGHVPEDPALWAYMTQVMQAEGVGMAIAGHRANKPRTMGTLYWQLNDVWPVVSWSSVDVFGRWKPLHYKVRELYKPVFAEVYQQGDSLRLRIVSDSLDAFTANVTIEAFDTVNALAESLNFEVDVPANGVADVAISQDEFDRRSDEMTVYRITVHDSRGSGHWRDWRHMLTTTSTLVPRWKVELADPQLDVQIEGNQLRLMAVRPALGVWIEDTEAGVNLLENYVDVFPGEEVVVELPPGFDTENLVVRSIWDLRAP